MNAIDVFIKKRKKAFIKDLQRLCRIPSLAGNPGALHEAAALVERYLRRAGAATRVFRFSNGAPIIYGEMGTGSRTLLIYNHYDVQPADPLQLWNYPPFSATEAGRRLYGRGTSDNKGNLMARIHALETYRKCKGPLPIKIKFLIEGEEETTSKHLPGFVRRHRRLLQADGCLWECSWKDPKGRLILACGLKGLCFVELRVTGARRDLHSSMASIVPNPAWRLVWALGTLFDERYTIRLKGWYEKAQPVGRSVRRMIDAIPFDERRLRQGLGIKRFVKGLRGKKLVYDYLYAPTCTICGLKAGFTGEGAKTVLPSEATAKLDFRLVPGMAPDTLLKLLRRHLDTHGYSDIEIRYLGGVMPAQSDCNDAVVTAAAKAARLVYRNPPIVYPLAPWSGPLHEVCGELGIASVSFGVGHVGSRDHAPDENIFTRDYVDGIKLMLAFIDEYAGSGGQRSA